MKRVLIANRGEIAVRVARGCRLLGIDSVAVFSEADAGARHVREADLAVCIGPAAATESYLSIPALLEAARKTGADAVHPGYGFLSENAAFARAVQDAGMTWIGPPADVIDQLEGKSASKAIAVDAGVPVAAARRLQGDSDAELQAILDELGLPLLVKPEHGGGGKGMARVHRPEELRPAIEAARRVAAKAFASDALFVERLIENARHVEVQVLADRHGGVTHVFERECSLQRRHQKVIEEAPCAVLSDTERAAICESGRAFAARVGYEGAGTVEFLFDPVRREHMFLEMNTRLQVEHPVTEMITGVDLVVAQLRIARGERLETIAGLRDGGPSRRGVALEARIYAEDPAAGYLPQTGRLERVVWPDGPFVRVDCGYEQGDVVGHHYDPLLAKLIVWGADREQALDRLAAALDDTVLHGVRSNLGLLRALCDRPEVRAAEMHTGMLDAVYADRGPGIDADLPALLSTEPMTAAAAMPDAALLLAAAAVAGPGGPLAGARAGGSAESAEAPGLGGRDPYVTLAGFRSGAGGAA
ncbi:MAG: hypothetical protein RIT45_3502 [Pseudomonadota bacterium]